MKKHSKTQFLFYALLVAATGRYAFGLERLDNHWAAAYIKPLMDDKVIEGYPDDTIRPDRLMTRAELSLVLNKITGGHDSGQTEDMVSFSDTFDHWAQNAISTTYRYGIMLGSRASGSGRNAVFDNIFNPDGYITREEACASIARCVKYINHNSSPTEPSGIEAFSVKSPDTSAAKASEYFTDWGSVSSWAADDINELFTLGLIHGYPDGSFRPRENASRAEIFTILSLIGALNDPAILGNGQSPDETPDTLNRDSIDATGAEQTNPLTDLFPLSEYIVDTPYNEADSGSVPFVAFSAQMGSRYRTVDVEIKLASHYDDATIYYLALEKGKNAPSAAEIAGVCKDEIAGESLGKACVYGVIHGTAFKDAQDRTVRLTLEGGEGLEGSSKFKDGYNYELYMTVADVNGNMSPVVSSPPVMALPFHARSSDNKTFTIKEIDSSEIADKYADLQGESPLNSEEYDRTAIQLENIRLMAELYDKTNGTHGDNNFLMSSEYTYVLASDIDLKNYGANAGWVPIGGHKVKDAYDYFGGSFDGQNYRITNMTIDADDSRSDKTRSTGLFGRAEGAYFRNMELVNPQIRMVGNYDPAFIHVGSLAGEAISCVIENVVISSPEITAYASGSDRCLVGGAVGVAKNTDISYVYINNLDIKSGDGTANMSQAAGGVAGRYIGSGTGLFHDLTVSGCIQSQGWTVGGAVGSMDVTSGSPSRIHCQNIDTSVYVDGGKYAGGIAGIVGYEDSIFEDGKLIFENCTSSGSVKGEYVAGGLFGRINASNRNVVVKRSTANNRVSIGIQGVIGGFVGEATSASIENCVSDGVKISGFTRDTGGFAGVARGDTDFINCITRRDVEGAYNVGGFIGSAWGNVYFQDCGTESKRVASSGPNTGGFIGLQKNGTTRFYNCYASCKVEGTAQTGGFAGYAGPGAGKTEFLRSYASGDVTGSNNTGGFIGKLGNESELRLCYATGNVMGESAGGFIGDLSGDSNASAAVQVVKCHAKGSVYATDLTAGGFIADLKYAYVDQCFASGDVKKSGTGLGTGGFCGRIASGGTVTNSYALGDISANGAANGSFAGLVMNNAHIGNSYGNGSVTGLTYTGGFVGRLLNDGSQASVTGCVSLSDLVSNTANDQTTNRFAGASGGAGIGDCYAKENAVVRMGSSEIKLISPDGRGVDGYDLRAGDFRDTLELMEWDTDVWDLDTINGTNGKESLGRPTLLENQ